MRRVAGLFAFFLAGSLAGCSNPGTPAGYVGYLTRGAVVGKTSYVGLQTGPTSFGLGWMMNVMNVSVTPFSYAEDFTGDNAVLAQDKLMIGFRAHTIFRVRSDKVKEFVEQYTTIEQGRDQVQVAFGNFLREPLRTEIRAAVAHYDAFSLNASIGKINQELTAWAQEKTRGTPFEVLNVVVGNIQFPAAVSQAVGAKLAASQDLETRATQVEIAKKDAEKRIVEAEGIAKATQIIQQRLTPLYVQHEAIEAQKAMVGSQNHTTIYIPVGPMGVPIVSTRQHGDAEGVK
ncbi:MAG TPA: SPFH domain-containing protein [Anaeromyxobacteraceae bacterium]|jgi:regulator of protease activity HflC (stomatin/prohibitin superfamily)|nr:SPFH domain-containing protein [Anaeromyxobacteraceae bacterium]